MNDAVIENNRISKLADQETINAMKAANYDRIQQVGLHREAQNKLTQEIQEAAMAIRQAEMKLSAEAPG